VSFAFVITIVVLHFGLQVTAIRRSWKMKSSYITLILLSDLFLFLGFALQVDVADGPGSYVAIDIFYNSFFGHGDLSAVTTRQTSIDVYASLTFLIALLISWFFFLGKSFLNQEGHVSSPAL
jgi:hypothetical protein